MIVNVIFFRIYFYLLHLSLHFDRDASAKAKTNTFLVISTQFLHEENKQKLKFLRLTRTSKRNLLRTITWINKM